jgi:mannan endo-1,4-beta-mannosidase
MKSAAVSTFSLLLLTASCTLADAPSQVVTFLRGITGKSVVSGHHNDRKIVAEPFKWTEAIRATTGKDPGFWSSDFSFDYRIEGREEMIREAAAQWKRGAIVNIMWHACPPTMPEPCTWDEGIMSQLTDEQWHELITPGTPLNLVWLERVDSLVPHLRQLEAQGVEVLFRPLHEMNQKAFWWGGRPGPDGTRRLYQITHDRLVKHHGLKNLVWVWNVQDLSRDFAAYDPGPEYWDILSFDVYADSGFTLEKYEDMAALAGAKPFGIGECSVLPTPVQLAAQPRWSFFMGWAGLVHEKSTADEIRAAYADPRVLTLEEMPGWAPR